MKKYPLCRICKRPMMVGQTDAHYVCIGDPIGNLERGLELSQGSADAKWTTRQAAAVDQAIRNAAATNRIFHLWWHPHNFGRDLETNLAALESILHEVSFLRERFGFESVSMAEAAGRVMAEG